MKHVLLSCRMAAFLAVSCLGLIFSSSAFAQANVNVAHGEEIDPIYGDSLDGFNANLVMQKAFEKGLQPEEAAMFLAKCKRNFIDRRYNLVTPGSRNTDLAAMRVPAAVAMAPCTNMDFESGSFTGWTGFIGDNTLSSSGPLQNIQNGFFSNGINALTSDMNARHTLMMNPGAGNDPCGGFPCVAPGGNWSVRLGNSYANYQGEAIEQTFTVGPGNTSFTYQYAVVLNDGGHSAGEQPYFRIEMFDQSGNLIPCAQYYVEASGTIPGFITCGVGTSYKPWTTVNADLTAYVGQNVTIRFTAAGCIYAGHYGYAYVDASCLPYTITMSDSLCTGGSIVLSAPVGAQSYQWSTGATTDSIIVSTAGSYSVTMTSVTGCQTILTRNVYLYPQPTAAFTPNAPNCSSNFTFANNSSISSGQLYYQWDFGDPSITTDTSSQANPTFNYPNPGTYTVTLIVTSASGCVDTITQVVSPGNGGQAAFSNTSVCVGSGTQFTDQSTGASAWNWNFGDPTSGPADSSNLQNPTHIFTSAGTYTVTLTAQTNPCPSIITHTVTVYPSPTATFTVSQVCGQQTVNFTSTSTVSAPYTISGTSWNFGDPASAGNNTSTLTNPTHTFTAPGTYTVTITTTTGNGCTQTSQQAISVGLPPQPAFVANSVCTNSPMSFTNQSVNTNNYYWDFGDPSTLADTSNAVNPTYTYTNAGTYTVMLIGNPGPCSDTALLSVTVAPGPQVQFAAPTVCVGSPTSFTDQSTITTGSITAWHWDFGEAALSTDTSNLQNPSYTYTSAGTYTVALTCTSGTGCQTTNTMTVTVNPLPLANFSSNVVCVGTPTSFTDLSTTPSGNITNWTWDFGDGSPTSATQNPTHTYGNDTTYSVSLIVQNNFGCIDTLVLPAVTASQPNVLFTADTFAGCPVLCANFQDQTTIASGSITGWTWDFGDGSPQAFTQNPSHCYSQAGTYTVTMTATSNGGCAQTLVIPNMITVYPTPVAMFTATPQLTTVLNTTINFVDLSSGNPTTWSWNFGDPTTLADTSGLQNPQYTYTDEYGDTYPVQLVVTNQYGCVDDTSLEVIVEPEFTFFIPNAFTPNHDGVNDFFFGTGIGITSYDIWIFDRWGNLIFHTNDINQGWDGTVQGASGQICQEDVYVWKVALTDVFAKKHKYIGHVSLIK